MSQQFVILEHDHPFLHWDFLLDNGDTLNAWRLLSPLATDRWITAEVLPDHRRIYLEYEGEVSGGRGSVQRILNGRYQELPNRDSSERHFTITNCQFCQLAIQRSKQDGSSEWRFQ